MCVHAQDIWAGNNLDVPGHPLPPAAESAKAAGNRAMFDRQFSAAIEHFSQ